MRQVFEGEVANVNLRPSDIGDRCRAPLRLTGPREQLTYEADSWKMLRYLEESTFFAPALLRSQYPAMFRPFSLGEFPRFGHDLSHVS